MPANDWPVQHAASPAALSHRHETKELKGGCGEAKLDYHYYKILMPRLARIIFFWVGSRRWNVNKSIRARSWGLRLPLLTIKRLFMLPWRAIPVTLAHWREPQIMISFAPPPFCRALLLDSGFFFSLPPSSSRLFFPFHCPLSIPPFPLQLSLLPAPSFFFFLFIPNALHHNPLMRSALPQLCLYILATYSRFFTAPLMLCGSHHNKMKDRIYPPKKIPNIMSFLKNIFVSEKKQPSTSHAGVNTLKVQRWLRKSSKNVLLASVFHPLSAIARFLHLLCS